MDVNTIINDLETPAIIVQAITGAEMALTALGVQYTAVNAQVVANEISIVVFAGVTVYVAIKNALKNKTIAALVAKLTQAGIK